MIFNLSSIFYEIILFNFKLIYIAVFYIFLDLVKINFSIITILYFITPVLLKYLHIFESLYWQISYGHYFSGELYSLFVSFILKMIFISLLLLFLYYICLNPIFTTLFIQLTLVKILTEKRFSFFLQKYYQVTENLLF